MIPLSDLLVIIICHHFIPHFDGAKRALKHALSVSVMPIEILGGEFF